MDDNSIMAWHTDEQMYSTDLPPAELTDDELEAVAGGWCGNEINPRFRIPTPGPVDPTRAALIGLLLPAVQKVW